MRRPKALAPGCALALVAQVALGAELKLLLPLGRSAYQTNETLDLAAVRAPQGPLATGDLVLKLSGENGTRMSFTFPVGAVPVSPGEGARATEHLHINGWLLRPGNYTLEVSCDGAAATTRIEVYSHVRKSDFKLIVWGRAKGKAKLVEGEDSIGFNLIYAHYTNDDDANYIRAGCDVMPNCVMGGGHQMDLRQEGDWSDPYVVKGGTARVAQRALQMRVRPNVPGIHFYDEPGLTRTKDRATGQGTPHGVPAQLRSYKAAFGREWLSPHNLDPDNPDHVRRWRHWATWKLGLMDAAWKDARFGVRWVEPGYLCATQSQYGWSAFTDGYYFNVVRSLPVVSGHGGYHDYGPGYFNPSFFLEMARARDMAKPCWYLPCWYGNTTSDQFRLEQYLSFQTNIQGMQTPPDIDPLAPAEKPAAQGVVESNHLMASLGTIFTTMPPTRPPVAMLYSLSDLVHEQIQSKGEINYAHQTDHGQESIALIAYDAEGMAEAVGTLYEMVAGVQPLTRWRMPVASSITPATSEPGLLPELRTAWVAVLPDRVTRLAVERGRLVVSTHDGSVTTLSPDGKPVSQEVKAEDKLNKPRAEPRAWELARKNCPPNRVLKLVAERDGLVAAAHWGGTLIVYDKAGRARFRQQMPQDITAMAWLAERLMVGLADGRLVALAAAQ